MVKTQTQLPEIRKEAFIKAREALGLSQAEVSGKTCLSERQIAQIENGETSSFYGAQVKVTAAKKVASVLNLKEEDAFHFAEDAADKKAGPDAAVQEKKIDPPETSVPAKPILVKQTVGQLPSAKASSTSSKKKALIFISVVVVLVFSVINLRPLFFPVKEEVVVVEEAQPATTSADHAQEEKPDATPRAEAAVPNAANTAAVATSADCPAVDVSPLVFHPDAPKKAGDMVYLQAKTSQTICVIDAAGKIQNKTLEPGVGLSVYGKPPLKVLTQGLAQVEVYYQGVKLRLANAAAKTVVLEPAELNQPLAPTDSQFR